MENSLENFISHINKILPILFLTALLLTIFQLYVKYNISGFMRGKFKPLRGILYKPLLLLHFIWVTLLIIVFIHNETPKFVFVNTMDMREIVGPLILAVATIVAVYIKSKKDNH